MAALFEGEDVPLHVAGRLGVGGRADLPEAWRVAMLGDVLTDEGQDGELLRGETGDRCC